VGSYFLQVVSEAFAASAAEPASALPSGAATDSLETAEPALSVVASTGDDSAAVEVLSVSASFAAGALLLLLTLRSRLGAARSVLEDFGP